MWSSCSLYRLIEFRLVGMLAEVHPSSAAY